MPASESSLRPQCVCAEWHGERPLVGGLGWMCFQSHGGGSFLSLLFQVTFLYPGCAGLGVKGVAVVLTQASVMFPLCSSLPEGGAVHWLKTLTGPGWFGSAFFQQSHACSVTVFLNFVHVVNIINTNV